MAASAEGEVAQDIGSSLLQAFPTVTGNPHGAFTDALIRVLDGKLAADADNDGQLTLAEMQAAISGFMASRAYGHTPQRLPSVSQDTGNLGSRVFFGRSAGSQPSVPVADAGPLRVSTFEEQPGGALRNVLGQMRALRSVSVSPRTTADVLISVEDAQFVVMTSGMDILKKVPVSDPGAAARKIGQLAWTRRLWSMAERNRRGLLQWSYDPDQRGGNFRIGCDIRFATRPDRPAWLLLLNTDSSGRISVLYPNLGQRAEFETLKPGQLKTIPDASSVAIRVQAPEGIDIQIALAFDQRPSQLEALAALTEVDTTDPRLDVLFDLLESTRGRFTAARSDLRTLPADPSGKCI